MFVFLGVYKCGSKFFEVNTTFRLSRQKQKTTLVLEPSSA